MKFCLIIVLFSFTLIFGFLYNSPAAWSGDVGVIPEAPAEPAEPAEPELPQITLNLAGKGCETNLNESELLRLKGVVGVDIESKPGKIIVTYDPAKLTKQQIKGAVGKKKGGCAAAEDGVDKK
jgi:copper chaperone CopZ